MQMLSALVQVEILPCDVTLNLQMYTFVQCRFIPSKESRLAVLIMIDWSISNLFTQLSFCAIF